MSTPGPLPMADCHDDLILGVLSQRERGNADVFGDFWLPQLRAGGVVLQVLPIFTEAQFLGEGALRRALRAVETAWWLADRHAHDVAVVTTAGELRATIDGGRIALLLALEGMEPVGVDLDLVDTFWRLGVRMGGLCWNRRTMLADGLGESGTGGGLTSLGVRAVARMEELGMVVDVSHLSDAGFEHVSRVATRPFVASHSSCRSLHGHPRNLTDAMLRAIAQSGGFAGMNAIGALCADEPSVDDYLAHIAHAVSVVGPEHVALGLDFVADLFTQLDPILEGVLIDAADLRLIEGLKRPADLAALGSLLLDRLGDDTARWVTSRTMIQSFGRLLPA